MWMISTCHFILQFNIKLLLSSKAVLAMVVGWKDINLTLSNVAAVLGLLDNSQSARRIGRGEGTYSRGGAHSRYINNTWKSP